MRGLSEQKPILISLQRSTNRNECATITAFPRHKLLDFRTNSLNHVGHAATLPSEEHQKQIER